MWHLSVWLLFITLGASFDVQTKVVVHKMTTRTHEECVRKGHRLGEQFKRLAEEGRIAVPKGMPAKSDEYRPFVVCALAK